MRLIALPCMLGVVTLLSGDRAGAHMRHTIVPNRCMQCMQRACRHGWSLCPSQWWWTWSKPTCVCVAQHIALQPSAQCQAAGRPAHRHPLRFPPLLHAAEHIMQRGRSGARICARPCDCGACVQHGTSHAARRQTQHRIPACGVGCRCGHRLEVAIQTLLAG